jgi:septum formation protein
MMSAKLNVILASKSPRRKQILEWAAIPFEVKTEDTPEDFSDDMPVRDVPAHLALLKGQAVAATIDLSSTVVIAADTIVLLNNKIYGKPVERNDAIRILQELSGNMHEVITGVSLHWQQQQYNFSETTKVWFSPLTQTEIEFYVDTYAPYDKAGAYAIQEWIGVTTIQKVEGCFFNVMGLPMNRLYHEMKRMGLID